MVGIKTKLDWDHSSNTIKNLKNSTFIGRLLEYMEEDIKILYYALVCFSEILPKDFDLIDFICAYALSLKTYLAHHYKPNKTPLHT